MTRDYPTPLTVSTVLSKNLDAILEKSVVGEDARQTLGELLQAALQLEFATIPPYLSAVFSLKEENEAIKKLILRVAKEEMLHMTVVANLMNAIGIPPNIKRAVPEYPFQMSIIEPSLCLDLESFSLELVEKLFMQIEAPEEPVNYEGLYTQRPRTIGQFYAGIIELIEKDAIPNLFVNAERDKSKQIQMALRFDHEPDKINYRSDQEAGLYPLKDDIDFLIIDKASALRHLNWIVFEGEGADKRNPIGPEGIPGHYYRFESILRGKYLIQNETAYLSYSYSGGRLPFSPAGVHEFDPNTKAEAYANFPGVFAEMSDFNREYTTMIDRLHAAFDGPDPYQAYKESISAMMEMSRISGWIIEEADEIPIKAGIPFQYIKSAPPDLT